MDKYIYNKNCDANAQHEIHKSTCSYAPTLFNKGKIGLKIDNQYAFEAAQKMSPSKSFYLCRCCCHTWYLIHSK